ncbi:farnesol dehydrogenase-like [Hylaeus anthracinus]|uniref:farnesol dehydrogenase-like n=1 Tax=Hylaeus anthracinus TaxID=313031 RepID=UPI0023B88FBA|nr:farnesol dehydrogenase-like [Hylaeus anthracinus]
MDRWIGKVAIVTGASAGIGASTVKVLVGYGVKVVGLARDMEKLEKMSAELGKDKFYPIKCDLRKEEDITNAFKWVETKLGGADVLINNAGIATSQMIIENPTEEYRKILDTNVLAPAICSRLFAQSMKKRNGSGHIININSIVGHFAESVFQPMGMYPASKYALRALSTELRHEFINSKLKIRVTSVSPGGVETDLVHCIPDEVLKQVKILHPNDIADAVAYALGTPENVEIIEITVMPKNEYIYAPPPNK